MHILKTSFNGNPNVGLYGFATDKYCLLSPEVGKSVVKEVEKVLKVPVHQLNICGTSLLGAFLAGNSEVLLVPSIAFKEELKKLGKLGIKYEVIETKHTALGNNIACNDKGCLISSDFSEEEKEQIQKALCVDVEVGDIAGLNIVGSSCVFNDKGCLLHRDASEKEEKMVERLLGVKCETGTVSLANPYVKSGIIANSNGFIVGNLTSGPEINHIDHVLGFLNG